MSSPEAPTSSAAAPDGEAPSEVDEVRLAQLGEFGEQLGDAIIGTEIRPNEGLWIRVATEAWGTVAEVARRRLGYAYFCFLSAIDWRPSPFGRYEDAEVDTPLATKLDAPWELQTGIAGGDTRFQVFARVADIGTGRAVFFKVDVPDDALAVESWVGSYAGADWHERETWEMFGIDFLGHPDLRNIYLPTGFEGHPLRKDFPLLARVVKPWPGIVDVEPMPGEEATEEEAGDTEGSSDD